MVQPSATGIPTTETVVASTSPPNGRKRDFDNFTDSKSQEDTARNPPKRTMLGMDKILNFIGSALNWTLFRRTLSNSAETLNGQLQQQTGDAAPSAAQPVTGPEAAYEPIALQHKLAETENNVSVPEAKLAKGSPRTVPTHSLQHFRPKVSLEDILREALSRRDGRTARSAFPSASLSRKTAHNRRLDANRRRSNVRVDSPLVQRPTISLVSKRVTNGTSPFRRSQRIPQTPQQVERRARAREVAKQDRFSLEALISSLPQTITEEKQFPSYSTILKARAEREKEILRLKELDKSREIAVRPLSKDTLDKVRLILRGPFNGEVLIDKFRISIKRMDIGRLKEPEWLNDELINFYMQMICDRAGGKPRIHAWNTYFYPNLSEKGYASVARWATRAKVGGDKIMDLDFMIVPINVGGMHWCLGIVNFQKKRLEYYDSLPSSWDRKAKFFRDMRDYFTQETKGKIQLNEWENYVMPNEPRQQNSWDCGLFMCKTAEIICKGSIPSYTQKDIPGFRLRMVAEIIAGKLDVD